MSVYIQSKFINGATILFLELEDGSIYFESVPLYGCNAILAEGERITREFIL